MSIRPATMEDYPGICSVFDEVDVLHREALPHVYRDPGGPARSKAYIASIIEDENACLWIAEHEEQIVAVLHITIRHTRAIPLLVPRRYAVIENIAVTERHRRRGIGHALMRAADQWAWERNVTQIELHVWEFNAGARAFYEGLGYHTASRRMWRRLLDMGTPTGPDSR